jgi:hypothetical protein
LSDAPVRGDAPASVTVRLDDGRRRRLLVTAQEAAALAKKGHDATRARDRIGAWFSKRAWKWLGWGVGILVTSLAIPAATKQWSDRQAAIALKADLIRDISQSSVAVFTGAKRVADAKRVSTGRAELLKTRDAWEISEGGIDARYAVYFRGTRARQPWLIYRDRVYDYISLGCCDTHRSGDILLLREYVGASKPWPTPHNPWDAVACGSGESCTSKSPEFADAYTWIGIRLLRKRQILLDGLQGSRPIGFSGGWHDFVRDTFAPIRP